MGGRTLAEESPLSEVLLLHIYAEGGFNFRDTFYGTILIGHIGNTKIRRQLLIRTVTYILASVTQQEMRYLCHIAQTTCY